MQRTKTIYMDKQLAIIFMIVGGLLLLVGLFYKNNKDKKRLYTGTGNDAVEEEHTMRQFRTDKL